jgi:hypothetical protein
MDPVRPQHHYMTTATAVLMFTALHTAAGSERLGRRRQDPDARCMRQSRMLRDRFWLAGSGPGGFAMAVPGDREDTVLL